MFSSIILFKSLLAIASLDMTHRQWNFWRRGITVACNVACYRPVVSCAPAWGFAINIRSRSGTMIILRSTCCRRFNHFNCWSREAVLLITCSACAVLIACSYKLWPRSEYVFSESPTHVIAFIEDQSRDRHTRTSLSHVHSISATNTFFPAVSCGAHHPRTC